MSVWIENFLPLETRAQGRDLNPDPEPLQAACLHFPGVNSPQAEVKKDYPKGENSQAKRIITSNGGAIKAPNGGNKISIICFMGLKTTLVAIQDVSSEESTGPGPNPMTATQEQDNQVANSRSLTNERAPGLGAISLPLNPSTQIPQAHFS
ncbi:hypothetical protein DSO57_1027466 [Entomophthora muscae]|uniref:Uncharacterized protein n=1 Tax=Entomophthora muscae TaxID=34485 RepID=A0ACC2TNX7_9FUNG|nr:hypothetical protein DSO57_1027466 [Entomophthora muscae]